jgi:hypothetical protein
MIFCRVTPKQRTGGKLQDNFVEEFVDGKAGIVGTRGTASKSTNSRAFCVGRQLLGCSGATLPRPEERAQG